LPKTKYPPLADSGYSAAPLDELSLWNGLCKFQHPQYTITAEEFVYLYTVLDQFFPDLGQHSQLGSDSLVLQQVHEHTHKACGYPWSAFGCSDKGDALYRYGLSQIESYYSQYTSIISSTLKDELRLVGKDARFFRPQDVASYIEGARLFYHQNQYIMHQAFTSPVFCRFVTPGQQIPELFRRLHAWNGKCFAADGQSWDANFPLIFAQVIALFRSVHLPAERVSRYYSQMYNGFTLVGGHLFHLCGQASGHYNTSIDNSLGQVCAMALHACRQGILLDDFMQQLLFFCCGDDLIYSDRTNLFNPRELSDTYASIGMYLEFENNILNPMTPYSLSFVGVHMLHRVIRGVPCWLYSIRTMKARANTVLHKSTDPKKLLAKLSSVAQMVFGDEELFNFVTTAFHNLCAQFVRENLISVMDPDVIGCVRSISFPSLLQQYLSWESFFASHDSLKHDVLEFCALSDNGLVGCC